MVVNSEFRKQLKEWMGSNDDQVIVQGVLEHAWIEWPRPTLIWFFRKIKQWDHFKDNCGNEVEPWNKN